MSKHVSIRDTVTVKLITHFSDDRKNPHCKSDEKKNRIAAKKVGGIRKLVEISLSDKSSEKLDRIKYLEMKLAKKRVIDKLWKECGSSKHKTRNIDDFDVSKNFRMCPCGKTICHLCNDDHFSVCCGRR